MLRTPVKSAQQLPDTCQPVPCQMLYQDIEQTHELHRSSSSKSQEVFGEAASQVAQVVRVEEENTPVEGEVYSPSSIGGIRSNWDRSGIIHSNSEDNLSLGGIQEPSHIGGMEPRPSIGV